MLHRDRLFPFPVERDLHGFIRWNRRGNLQFRFLISANRLRAFDGRELSSVEDLKRGQERGRDPRWSARQTLTDEFNQTRWLISHYIRDLPPPAA